MVAWYWLLLVVLLSIAAIIITWMVVRSRPASTELLEAEKSKAKRLQEELAAEKDAAAKVATELQRFASETRKVQEWYNAQKDLIAKEARDALPALVANPSELDRRLDILLGAANKASDPREDPTPRG